MGEEAKSSRGDLSEQTAEAGGEMESLRRRREEDEEVGREPLCADWSPTKWCCLILFPFSSLHLCVCVGGHLDAFASCPKQKTIYPPILISLLITPASLLPGLCFDLFTTLLCLSSFDVCGRCQCQSNCKCQQRAWLVLLLNISSDQPASSSIF